MRVPHLCVHIYIYTYIYVHAYVRTSPPKLASSCSSMCFSVCVYVCARRNARRFSRSRARTVPRVHANMIVLLCHNEPRRRNTLSLSLSFSCAPPPRSFFPVYAVAACAEIYRYSGEAERALGYITTRVRGPPIAIERSNFTLSHNFGGRHL